MKMKFTTLIIYLAAGVIMLPACGKFDRSKIAMPKMKFITGENLHSVICVDTGHAWIFGNHGTIYFSSDGGTTWAKQESGVEVLLGDASFVSKDEGWAVGVAGTVVHTSDAGKTWKQQKSSTEKDLLDVFFLDAQHGWAVGEQGTLIHTDDGGNTWASPIEPQDTAFNSVFFADLNSGWIVGEFGTIMHSEDGGKTWSKQECKDIVPVITAKEWERPLPALYGIFFQDRNRGWITGMDGVIIKTEDGGQTWTKVSSGTELPLYSILIRGDRGWAVGNKGIYLMSNDGGSTWAPKDGAIKSKFWLRQIAFCDENNGFVVGATGTVAITNDGGKTWKIISGFSYEMEEFGLADF
jgi:photosystem II stability/assembly factor-like uncharacterized protein